MVLNAHKIEIILANRDITKTQFAKKCGLSKQSVSTILRRGTCEPKTAGRLAAGLGVDVNEIIKDG